MAPAADSTSRFSSRVADYISSRPSYPQETISLLENKFKLGKGAKIADIGCGTGILTSQILELLSEKDVQVIGIEPNREMREACSDTLSNEEKKGRLSLRDGTAENTGLEDQSIDLIVAAQAFHWFDVPRARQECKRILKSTSCGVALIWNDRRGVDGRENRDVSSFLKIDRPVMSAYDLLLVRRANDYEKVDHHSTVNEQTLRDFFGPGGFSMETFPNPYQLSYKQLEGRLLSSSYTPQKGEEGHDIMIQELQQLFDMYQRDGKIDFIYDTRVIYGSLT